MGSLGVGVPMHRCTAVICIFNLIDSSAQPQKSSGSNLTDNESPGFPDGKRLFQTCFLARSMPLRWAVNIGRWEPADQELAFLLELIPEAERKEVQSFKFLDDRKRALCSRLLQRQCTSQALGLVWREVVIKRTRGRKPFAASEGQRSDWPNFNFNVSHEVRHVCADQIKYQISRTIRTALELRRDTM